MRTGRNGGGVANSFIMELDDGDTVHMEVKNITGTDNIEYSHMGFMLVPIGL